MFSLLEFSLGLLFLILALIFCILLYARWNYGSLESLGIPVVKPHFFLGSNYNGHKLVHHLVDLERMKKFGLVYGVYDGRHPMVYICDPEIIRLITTKDSDYFDKRSLDMGHDVLNEVLELLPTGEKWRTLKSQLTPLLTSGKLKPMKEIVCELSAEYIQALMETVKGSDDGSRAKIDFAQFLPPFAIEMIGLTLCGIKFEDARNPNNEVIKNMRIALLEGLSFDWFYNWSRVFPVLNWIQSGFPTDGLASFKTLMNEVMSSREKSGLQKLDMVGKLVELRAKVGTPEFKRLGITKTTILSQAFEFLIASYFGIVTELNYLAYYLANYPKVQDKLLEEIDAILRKSEGDKIEVNTIGEMPYLMACLKETFRICSGFFRPDRVCLKDWQHTDSGLKIKKGMGVVFPIFAIHFNPEFYPNPTEFEPERWLNSETRNNFAFLTFGHGPRACAGERFIYEMFKIFCVNFFKDFKIEKRVDTVWNVHAGNHFFLEHDPIYVDVVKRFS